VETFLTLVIAVGGIATGIGAIWTAMLARRQLNEQRQFLEEQTDIARRQTRLTEQSLAQTERSLSEQVQSLSEQSEFARLRLEVDLLHQLEERWNSQLFRAYRRRSLEHVKENFFVGGELLEVQHMNHAAEQLLDFFDELGYLTRTGVVRIERMYDLWWFGVRPAWALWEPAIKKAREESVPGLYEDLEHLYGLFMTVERERGGRGEPPTKEQLRQWVEKGLSHPELEEVAVDDKDTPKG
jgi:hypothetical protein